MLHYWTAYRDRTIGALQGINTPTQGQLQLPLTGKEYGERRKQKDYQPGTTKQEWLGQCFIKVIKICISEQSPISLPDKGAGAEKGWVPADVGTSHEDTATPLLVDRHLNYRAMATGGCLLQSHRPARTLTPPLPPHLWIQRQLVPWRQHYPPCIPPVLFY